MRFIPYEIDFCQDKNIYTHSKLNLESHGGSPKWKQNKIKSYQFADVHYDLKKSLRVQDCSNLLIFNKSEIKINLSSSSHCHVRFCPICELQGAFKMFQNLIEAMQIIKKNNPNYSFIFLTLTQKNCLPHEIRNNLKAMSEAWNRLHFMRKNPNIKGFFRSMEITKGFDDTAHPHYHALVCVNKSYYSKTYWSTERWAKEWQHALNLDYIPVCDVRKVDMSELSIKELIKYSVKSSDIFESPEWFEIIDRQMKNIRRYATGGNIKDLLKIIEARKDKERTDNEKETNQLYFNWEIDFKDYFLRKETK